MGMHQGSMRSPFLYAVVVDFVTEFAREGALSESLHADDLVPMSETILKRIFERQRSRKRSYVMKWKQHGNSHILVTG